MLPLRITLLTLLLLTLPACDDPAAPATQETREPQPPSTPTPAPTPSDPLPEDPALLAQVDADDFSALPAMSADGQRIAVPVMGGFSGYSRYAFVLVLDVTQAGVVERYRADDRSGEATAQIPAINRLLSDGGFRSMAEVAEVVGFDDASAEVDPDSGFAGTIGLHDHVDSEAQAVRGTLFEGPRRISVALRETAGTRTYRLPNLSYQPPRFRRIPRNCHASFMPGAATFWGRVGGGALLVVEVWGSGSDECFPWRLVVVAPAEGEAESVARIVEEGEL